jgi:hypothetical protein
VLRITKLVDQWGQEISNDAWGIVLDDEDMMVFRKMEAHPMVKTSVSGWASQVCPLGYADEDTQVAVADDVPADVPDDFWPLAVSLQL